MHVLIAGMTGSGKTTLAKILAQEHRKRGIKVAVLDPLKDEGWDADFISSDGDEFLEYVKSVRNHMLIADEGSISVGRYNVEMQWLATMSRHWGHRSYFIVQRATQIAATVRNQCDTSFIFGVGENDTRMFAEEWREPNLKNLEKIDKGEFAIVSRFRELRWGKLDFDRRDVTIGKERTDNGTDDDRAPDVASVGSVGDSDSKIGIHSDDANQHSETTSQSRTKTGATK